MRLVSNATLGDDGAGLTVLVTGAVGAVGRVAVFVAMSRGAKVLAGVRSKQVDEAKKLGANDVVALDDEGALGRLLVPIDLYRRHGGRCDHRQASAKNEDGGIIGSVVGEPAEAKARGLAVHAFLAHPNSKRLGELGALVASGKVIIPIARRFPLAEASAAQALAEAGGVGKVLLHAVAVRELVEPRI